MTEIKEYILDNWFPGYEEAKRNLDLYSDYELNLLRDNFPEDVGNLNTSIIHEVQWDISGTLFRLLINDWDDFYMNNEELVIDYCSEATFLEYNPDNNSYYISKEVAIDCCGELIREADKEYSINEDVDFRDIISELNKYYPIKFCEE